MRHFDGHERARVVWVGSNVAPERAEIYERTERMGLSTTPFTSQELLGGDLERLLLNHRIDWVILAGFLLKIPGSFIEAFRGQVVNIHPALLPSYGGKGMYGNRVHEAVWKAQEATTGISIHWVTEVYDAGDIIFQASCSIDPTDDVSAIAGKVRTLEHQYFPRVVEGLICDGSIPKVIS